MIHQLTAQGNRKERPTASASYYPQKHTPQINRHDIYTLHTKDELVQCIPAAGECYFVLFTWLDTTHEQNREKHKTGRNTKHRLEIPHGQTGGDNRKGTDNTDNREQEAEALTT